MIRQLFYMLSVQMKEFFREPGVIFWAFVFPVIIAWTLGIAFAGKRDIPVTVGVIKKDGASAVSELIKKKTAESRKKGPSTNRESAQYENFRFVYYTGDDAIRAVKKGIINLFIADSPDGSAEYHFDPDSQDATSLHLRLEKYFYGGPSGRIVPLSSPGNRYIDFLIPGLIAMQIMNSCLWGVGWSLIEWRIKKLLRRMCATPMRRSVYMMSHFLSRLALSVFELSILYLFAYIYFDVRIQGSITALLMMLAIGNMAFTGMAVFFSSRADNARVGNGILNAITMPMMVLSGIFFSYHNFPEWAVPVVSKLPLTILADSIRSVFIEGAGMADVAVPGSILALTGAAFFIAGVKIYKWY